MQIRIIGTAAELTRMIKVIEEHFEVVSKSRLYPCRNDPEQHRQYITAKEREPNEPIKEA